MTRIVFLDIDDVLLTARAHALPANAARIERMAAGGSYGLDLLDALPVTFDQCAVAWLNRLVAVAEARIVVHSSWRTQFAAAEIRAHLLSQDVTDVLHADLCCPVETMRGKAEDIQAWLVEHPEVGPWVCLDDESTVGHNLQRLGLTGPRRETAGRFVEVDPRTGLGPREYRLALEHFGLTDCLPIKGSPI